MAESPSTVTADLRAEVLSQFDHQMGDALSEFMKHLRGLDVDVMMFMARKSYCMHDVLTRLGYLGPDCPILTDRTLDFRLDHLSGKRVALVDDTVILGTTLARAREKLTAAGASVGIHALCVNKDYLKDVIKLDHVQMYASDSFVETLCAAEISCLAALPRPYIVDFPVSVSVPVPKSSLGAFVANTDWPTFTIDSAWRGPVLSYSSFPPDAIIDEIRSALGSEVLECVDIVKVRSFARVVGETAWFTLVPIVTMKPLRFGDAERLAKYLMDRVADDDPVLPALLASAVQKPVGWLRIGQHLLSTALGERFLRSVNATVPDLTNASFVDREATVHFGPELGARLSRIAPSVERAYFASPHRAGSSPSVRPAALPGSVHRRTETLFNDGDLRDGKIKLRNGQSSSGSLETDFAEIFLALHERYEKEARREARRLGEVALRATPEDAPHRDRLLTGVPFLSMTEHLAARYGAENTRPFQRLLSLVLDRLNDLGISVPITCEEEGVVYRAYRHGEDVPIHDGHLNLAFDVVEGLLATSGKASVPAIALEKMLALLFDLGVSQRYLLPKRDLPSNSPDMGMIHKAFALHGVVVQYRSRPRSATANQTWFSTYLVHRRVLAHDTPRTYVLGSRVDGSQVHHGAAAFAYGLGEIVGSLIGRGAYTKDHLVALTTTRDARSTLAAIQVETVLFGEWWRRHRSRIVNALGAEPARRAEMAPRVANGTGHIALNSAMMKAKWYRTDRWQSVIADGVEALRAAQREKEAREWASYWHPFLESQVVAGRDALEAKLSELTALCWEMAAWITVVIAGLDPDAPRTGAARQLQKLATWRTLMSKACIEGPASLSKAESTIEMMLEPGSTPTAVAAEARKAMDEIAHLCDYVDDEVSIVDSMLAHYGEPLIGRSYSHVLWYDLVDSRGNQVDDGRDVEEYRQQSFAVRQLINEQLRRLAAKVARAGGDLYVWEGDLRSVNDEKHLAFSGSAAPEWVVEALRTICRCANAHPGTRLRAVVAGVDFVDARLDRPHGGEISGATFLEHLSALKAELRRHDEPRSSQPCLLMLTGRRALNLRPNIELYGADEDDVTTVVAGSRRTSRAVYGWTG